jgi:hypothetical protein
MELDIAFGDITRFRADLVVMKHADGFHGADQAMARSVGFAERIPVGEKRLVETGRTSPRMAMFISVGPLYQFQYERIQRFGAELLDYVTDASSQVVAPLSHVATTIHGPGYGLDTHEAFLSLIAGLVEGSQTSSGVVRRITLVERNQKRCEYLKEVLRAEGAQFNIVDSGDVFRIGTPPTNQKGDARSSTAQILQFGERADQKPHLFVAMPFAEAYEDEYEIAISEAARAHAYNCLRLDREAFTGDIVAEIKKRIVGSRAIVALLNDLNPNVFLELGFALAHRVPTILIAKEGFDLPFDVRGMRCLRYKSINSLRRDLTAEIGALKSQGLLAQPA